MHIQKITAHIQKTAISIQTLYVQWFIIKQEHLRPSQLLVNILQAIRIDQSHI